MTIEITMPRLSDTMEEGTLIKWRVKVGDRVANGDVLADIETDKATMELQSFDDGTVARLALEENAVAPVGTLIMEIEEANGDGAASVDASEAAGEATVPGANGDAADAPRGRVSPVARRIAEEHGVDLAGITGSGPNGRIIKRDVLAVVEGTPSAPRSSPSPAGSVAAVGSSTTVEITAMRRVIARRLVESKTTIPHFTVTMTVDAGPLVALRTSINDCLAEQETRLSVNDFVLRSCALSLRRHPTVNASWSEASILVHDQINIGVAVALPMPPEGAGGLVVPVIREADTKGLRQLNEETTSLAHRARSQGLSSEEMSGGTFTVSNLGMYGVDHFEAIINPPEAAILAVGAVEPRPVVRDGTLVAGHTMTCTLSADHRVVDGAIAAAFLASVRKLLETPEAMLV